MVSGETQGRGEEMEEIKELASRLPGRIVEIHETIGSTNDRAGTLALENAPHGTVVIADRQTRGRGRSDRTWFSPSGLGLWFSMILRPPVHPSLSCQVLFLSGLALCEAVEICTAARPTIKWPNDLLLSGKKLAGILAESKIISDRVQFMVIGIGVNVNHGRNDFPIELREIATSLFCELDRKIARANVLLEFFNRFDVLYEQYLREQETLQGMKDLLFPRTLAPWKERARFLGTRVQVHTLEGVEEGVAQDILPTGALVLLTPDGARKEIAAGDLVGVR